RLGPTGTHGVGQPRAATGGEDQDAGSVGCHAAILAGQRRVDGSIPVGHQTPTRTAGWLSCGRIRPSRPRAPHTSCGPVVEPASVPDELVDDPCTVVADAQVGEP